MKQRKRIAALLMAGVMLFSSLPANALGAERQTTGSLCEHHPAHTAECGYAEGTEGAPCNHQHTDECYTFVTNCVHEHGADCYPTEGVSDNTATPSETDKAEPTACTHVCSEESGCISKELDCQHEHSSECGYIPAAEGAPCTYVCPICPVQALIDELPTAEELGNMTEEEQQGAYEKLQTAYDAYNALTAEQKAEITGAEIFDSLFAVFNGMVNTMKNQDNYNINSSVVTIDDSCGTDCFGHTITGSGRQTGNTITVTGGTHNITIENVNISTGDCAFSIESNAKVNLTLAGTNTLKSGYEHAGLQVPSGATLTITKASDGNSLEASGGRYAAGIGGVFKVSGGNITIEGGNVTATSGGEGAGIGSSFEGSGGNITITGGNVTATGEGDGAGIGGGYKGSGGNIIITGGNVTVQGGGFAAGIGGGCRGSGATIGNNCDSFTVGSNAVIIVTSGSPMIADPSSDRADWKGVIIEGSTGQVYGDAALSGDFTIPSGTTVTVPKGSSLTIEENVTLTVGDNAKLINNGIIKGDTDSTGGTLDGTGELTGTGTVADTITNKLRKDADVNISPSSAVYGSTVTLTATISRDTNTRTRTAAQNTVNFYLGTADNGKFLGTANVNGDTATLPNVTITEENGWTVGENTITAEYGGSMTLSPKTGTATLTVTIRLDTPGNPRWDSTTPGRAVWDAVENADGYSVQLYRDGGIEDTPVKATETAHQFNITEAGTYTFKVHAVGTDNYSDSLDTESGKLTFYKVSFDTDGGSPEAEDQCVLSDSQAKEPEAPSKNGYIFQGWYKDDTEWDFKNKITDNTTLTAKWEKESVSYISYSWDESEQELVRDDKETGKDYILIDNDSAATNWTAGWYVADGTVNLPSRVTVTGEVHLILKDGCHLNAGSGGIQVERGNSLIIYAQSEDKNTMGLLTATGEDYAAGIGSRYKVDSGSITINGGIVTATGRDYGAGIGGGYRGAGESITINGGIVTGTGEEDGAGIGGGYFGAGKSITINGGIVTGTGRDYGAGIGGGYSGAGESITINGGIVTGTGEEDGAGIGGGCGGAGRNITISGGTITATGEQGGAGIGGGYSGAGESITINGGTVTATGEKDGAGIGGGYSGAGKSITINGGTVTATGEEDGAGIGGGDYGAGESITINGGTVTATGGHYGAGIGGGHSGTGEKITITNGSVKASGISITPTDEKGNNVYLAKLAVQSGVNEVTLDSGTGEKTFKRAGDHPDGDTVDTAFYLYLTGQDHEITAANTKYKAFWDGSSNSFTIKPVAPTPTVTIATTASSITVEELENKDTYGGAEYSLDGRNWQPSNILTDLHSNTPYTVYARYKGNDTYVMSEMGTLENVSTSEASYTITIPAVTLVAGEEGDTANIEVNSEKTFDLGYNGRVDVTVKNDGNVTEDAKLKLKRQNDTENHTITSPLLVNNTILGDIKKIVATFKTETDKPVTISFAKPTETNILAGTYKGTITFEVSYSEQ